MIAIRKAHHRGHADHGWLDTYHTFSFATYRDPRHLGFRALRVINEDWVQPGEGFGEHPHHDMEIVTYVLDGALEHKDSMGNGEVLHAGELQRMSAGTGITHSEFNPSDEQPVHLYQIWLFPERKGTVSVTALLVWKRPAGDRLEALARVTKVSGARWTGLAMAEGSALTAGSRLDLAQGLAEITFASGARVIFQGPALFDVQSSLRGRLTAGALTARGPPQLTGFVIEMPGLTVLDLGTEFGVRASQAGASAGPRILRGRTTGVGAGGWSRRMRPFAPVFYCEDHSATAPVRLGDASGRPWRMVPSNTSRNERSTCAFVS
jgi:hypothetical protein